jgi:excisionase family DNA binding protein
MAEPLVGVPDVARHVGMPESWVYTHAAAGKLPGFKLGKYWRFRLSEIEAWLEAHRTGKASRP